MGTLPRLEFDMLETCGYKSWLPELPNYDSCEKGSPSDEMWDKFGFESFTPPQSPEQDSDVANSLSDPLSRSSSPQHFDTFNQILSDFTHTLPDLKDTCNEVFEQDCSNKLRKDCMWNGNKDAQTTLHRRGRSDSPAGLSCSPASSGCIDPRALFNSNLVSDRVKHCTTHRRFYPDSGPETPSDSEEEVDVVTVETRSPLKHNSSSNTTRTKCFGSILQQNKSNNPLTVISANRKQSDKINQTFSNSARTVSMIITNNDNVNGKKTYQLKNLKCFPVLSTPTAVTNSVGVKRKIITSEKPQTAVLQVMKITPSNNAYKKESEKTVPVSAEKRRVLSLEGVSMVSDTGIKRNMKKNAFPSNLLKENIEKLSLEPHQELNKQSSLTLIKKPKKYSKRQASYDEDSSTSSGSDCANQDSPSWPKKRCSSRFSSSSGSDEGSNRIAHNVLERQRRQDLRDLYHKLRVVVPKVADVKRAPKVNILKTAKEHVLHLQRTNEELKAEKLRKQRRRHALQQRLQKLAEEFTAVGNVRFSENPRLF